MKKQLISASIIILILGRAAGATALPLFSGDEISWGVKQSFVFTDETPEFTYRHCFSSNDFWSALDIVKDASFYISFQDIKLDIGTVIDHLSSGNWAEILGINSFRTAHNGGNDSQPIPTPEPSSIILFGIGLVGFAAYRRRSMSE